MQTMQEIEVWYILPAIRCGIAKAMVDMGIKQKDIALMLGVTKPAVSQYIKSKRAKEVEFDQETTDKIKGCAGNIAQNRSCAVKEIQILCNFIRKKGIVCQLHRKIDNISCSCNMCMGVLPVSSNQ